ncbi:MAG: hypothetical protein ACRD4Q_02175 [Candidatus Acidiferrales bacterium]
MAQRPRQHRRGLFWSAIASVQDAPSGLRRADGHRGGAARPPMAEPESALARAERQMREGMTRVERQANLVVRLAVTGRQREAKEAQKLLSTLEESLRLAQAHLRVLREVARRKP